MFTSPFSTSETLHIYLELLGCFNAFMARFSSLPSAAGVSRILKSQYATPFYCHSAISSVFSSRFSHVTAKDTVNQNSI